MINSTDDIVGLDYGAKRIGVARISPVAKIGEPLSVVDATSETVFDQISEIAAQHDAQAFVVGLPRGLDGQETQQTKECHQFAQKLAGSKVALPVYCVDEAGSSKAAEQRIADTGVDAPLDAVAAAVFVEDFVSHRDKESLLVQ